MLLEKLREIVWKCNLELPKKRPGQDDKRQREWS